MMTNRDSVNRGGLDDVLANLALIYRPQASPANEFLCAAEALIREQERALAKSRAEVERLEIVNRLEKGVAEHAVDAARAAEARAERLEVDVAELVEADKQAINTLDSLVHSMQLPMPDELHMQALREALPRLLAEKRAAIARATGNEA